MRKQYGLDMCLRVFPSASLVCVWKSLERRSRPSCQTRKIWAIITIILPAAKELCKSPPDQSLSLSLCAAERQRGEGNGTFPIGENIIKGGKKNKNKSTHSRWRGSRRRCERERGNRSYNIRLASVSPPDENDTVRRAPTDRKMGI